MAGVILHGRELSVRFGKTRALSGLSIAVESGQLVGLIGPNGAGKTTLLRTLCGLQRPHTGQVLIHGQPLPEDRELLRQIGFTPDTPPVYEQLSLRDYLRFIGRGYDLPKPEIEDRIDFWLEQLWLREKAADKIKTLSRGMRQRIGIARTMLPNPSIVLLDEPAAGLDPAGRAAFRQFLITLREQGKAIIISSHILADMDQYCSHIAIMSAGTLLRMDTVSAFTNGHADNLRRYAISFSRSVGDLRRRLTEITGLDIVTVDGERAEFTYSGQREHAADLLALLVKQGLPVASFAPAEMDLEQAYLQTGIRQVD